MMAMVALLASLLGAASASAAGAASAAAADYDVVVYGSSPAGIAAATAAGVLGLKVALYEPLPMIGGMGAAGNLALNDGGNGAEHTGLALNFTRANAEWYCKEGITSVCSNTSQVSHPESFVSEASFRKMLGTAGIGAERIKTDCRVLSATTGGTPSKITSAKLLCEKAPITATVWIDASYDGDLMVAAGDIDYTWGREATSTYNETLAGARAPSWAGVSGPKGVDAVGPDGKLLKYVYPLSELKPPGSVRRKLSDACVCGAGVFDANS
jgi:NADPH-dependent 2,4-dienoyl-CoA reductase/sulfur reductase-like enzyme